MVVKGIRSTRIRWAAGLLAAALSVLVAADSVPPSGHSFALPAAGGTPGLRVDFTAVSRALDPDAIGADETTYGHDATDATAQGLLSGLGIGYARVSLTLARPSDPSSPIVCGANHCDSGTSGDGWVAAMKGMGETPVIQLPDTLTPADAAAIVTHFNVRTGNPVHYWLIGNEPDKHGETAAAYSARFNSLCEAMKAADPAIKVGGGATAWYDPSFLTTFLRDSGSRVDFVDFHFYGEGGHSLETYAQLLGKLATMSSDLARLRSLISATVPSRAASIAIHVGEWNIAWDTEPVQFTGFASMWDADLLGRILSGGADGMSFGTKSGGLGLLFHHGAGVAPPAGYPDDSPMPLYEAIAMFTGAERFPRFGTAMVHATSSLGGVDVFASAFPDDIVIVNLNPRVRSTVLHVDSDAPESATEWQLTQPGAAPSAPASIGTAVSDNGSFALTLPAQSVTTLTLTQASGRNPAIVTSQPACASTATLWAACAR
jgi:hypothetical protein